MMVSIRKLEKLLVPYETRWGGSDGFGNTYQEYRRGEITTRLDTATWFLRKNPQKIYKDELIRICTELGLNIDNK